jgi:hypothetical protein
MKSGVSAYELDYSETHLWGHGSQQAAAGLTLGVCAHTLGGRMDRIAYAIACEVWEASGKSDGAAVSKW